MRHPPSPPADYVDFVIRCAGRLHAAARELTGDDTAATGLTTDLLAAAARRWGALRPDAVDPTNRTTAAAYVAMLFRREAASYGGVGARAPRGRTTDPSVYGLAVPPDQLAAETWARAGKLRRRRTMVAVGVAVLLALGLFIRPPALDPSDETVSSIPDAASVAPAQVPAGVDLLPDALDQLGLPRLRTPLPTRISLIRPVGPLPAYPLRRALAAFRVPGAPLMLLGEDGRVRSIPEDMLAAPSGRNSPSETRLPATALSPDGTALAVPFTGRLAVLDIPRNTVRRYVVPELTRSVVWFGRQWLLVGGTVSSVLLELPSGRRLNSTAQARTTLAPQGVDVAAAPVKEATPDDPSPSLSETAAPGDPPSMSPSARPGVDPSLAAGGGSDAAPQEWFVVPGSAELLAVGEPATAPARVRRYLPTPSGVFPLDAPLTGELADWVGPWRGAGFITRDWAVRDCGPTGLLPARYGAATLATVAIDPSSGKVQRLLVATGVGSFDPPQALGWVPLDGGLRRPPAMLVRAPGDSGTTNLLAWQPDEGRLHLVSTVDRNAAISIADLSK